MAETKLRLIITGQDDHTDSNPCIVAYPNNGNVDKNIPEELRTEFGAFPKTDMLYRMWARETVMYFALIFRKPPTSGTPRPAATMVTLSVKDGCVDGRQIVNSLKQVHDLFLQNNCDIKPGQLENILSQIKPYDGGHDHYFKMPSDTSDSKHFAYCCYGPEDSLIDAFDRYNQPEFMKFNVVFFTPDDTPTDTKYKEINKPDGQYYSVSVSGTDIRIEPANESIKDGQIITLKKEGCDDFRLTFDSHSNSGSYKVNHHHITINEEKISFFHSCTLEIKGYEIKDCVVTVRIDNEEQDCEKVDDTTYSFKWKDKLRGKIVKVTVTGDEIITKKKNWTWDDFDLNDFKVKINVKRKPEEVPHQATPGTALHEFLTNNNSDSLTGLFVSILVYPFTTKTAQTIYKCALCLALAGVIFWLGKWFIDDKFPVAGPPMTPPSARANLKDSVWNINDMHKNQKDSILVDALVKLDIPTFKELLKTHNDTAAINKLQSLVNDYIELSRTKECADSIIQSHITDSTIKVNQIISGLSKLNDSIKHKQ